MTTQLPAGTWTIDPSATTVNVSAKMLGLITVPATLDVVSGTIVVGEDHAVSKVEIVADASSYTSKNAKRNEHISSPDFLDAERFPTIRFEASGTTPGTSGHSATGTVTAKGTTAPIDVTITEISVDGERGSFTATASFDRNDVGVDKMPSFIIGQRCGLSIIATVSK